MLRFILGKERQSNPIPSRIEILEYFKNEITV